MKGEDSIFSFVKQPKHTEPASAAVPSSAPLSPPPPPPSENLSRLAARITELEAKLNEAQAKDACRPPAAAVALNPEPLASLAARITELEAKPNEVQAKDVCRPPTAAVALNPEPLASQQRILALERTVAELRKVSEAAGREAHAAKELAPGHDAVSGFKAELQASQQRVSARERFATELQKFTEASGRTSQAAKVDGKQDLLKFRDELEALRAKQDSAEAMSRRLTEAAERSMKNFEAGVLGELKERLLAMDAASSDITHKADLISATTAANAHRIDKLEERAAGLKDLEKRLEANDKKFEKLCEQQALRAKEDSAEAVSRGLTEAAERSMKNFEAGVLDELKTRLLALDAASSDIAHKANLISATTAGNAHRIDKLEERAAGLKYLENRLEANDKKIERLYELEALVQAVKVGMESLDNKFGVLAQDTAGITAEHKSIRSDIESSTHQMEHLTTLFNYFRTELAFLLPKKKEGAGDPR